MGRAAASQPAEQGGALEELRFHWGSAYDIGADGERYTARRRDAQGTLLTGSSPEALQLKIKADYQAMPVARDTPGNGESQQTMSEADERAVAALTLAKIATGVPASEAVR